MEDMKQKLFLDQNRSTRQLVRVGPEIEERVKYFRNEDFDQITFIRKKTLLGFGFDFVEEGYHTEPITYDLDVISDWNELLRKKKRRKS